MDIGNGKLLLGDCLNLMKQIPDGSVDMVLCDLPYGTTRNKWDNIIPFEPLWEHYWRVTKPNAAVVLTAQCPFDKVLGASQIKHLKYEWVWVKSKITGVLNAKKMPVRKHENILTFYKNQPTYNAQGLVVKNTETKQGSNSDNYGERSEESYVQEFTNWPRDVLEIKSEGNTFHPTQKPVALFKYLIKTYTNEGETVLDNCSGSGTTAIAAERTGRKWICMEKDDEYYFKSMLRIQDEVKTDRS